MALLDGIGFSLGVAHIFSQEKRGEVRSMLDYFGDGMIFLNIVMNIKTKSLIGLMSRYNKTTASR